MRSGRWFAVVVAAGVLAGTPAAHATFPGRNGQIAFLHMTEDVTGRPQEVGYRSVLHQSIRLIDPERRRRGRVLQRCRTVIAGEPVREGDCGLGAPVFAPDGRHVAFLVAKGGRGKPERSLLVLARPDGRRIREVELPYRIRQDYSAGAETVPILDLAGWSPRGDQLLAIYDVAEPSSATLTSQLFTLSLEGPLKKQLTRNGLDGSAQWSRRGGITFTKTTSSRCGRRHRRCYEPNVFLMRPGGTPRQITHTNGAGASWFPDGQRILFARDVLGGHHDLFSVRRDGRGLRRVTRAGSGGGLVSPDGRQLLFERDWSWYVSRLDGRRRRLLVEGQDPIIPGATNADAFDWQPVPARRTSAP